MAARTGDDGALLESRLMKHISRGFFRPVELLVEEVRCGAYAEALCTIVDPCGDEEIAGILAEIRAFSKTLGEREPEDARLALEADFNRLFVGPGKLLAPPWESYYASVRDGEGRGFLRGRTERSIADFYRENGFALPADSDVFPDHIGVELEFLALLAAQEAQAHQDGAAEEVARLQEVELLFRERHVRTWVGDFARDVATGASTPFYRSLALLVARIV